jgi:uncharacterized membrane protein (DUF373 family)
MNGNKKRGQLSIMGIMMVFIMLIVYTALRPALVDVISNAGLTGTEGLIGDLFPTLILLGILGSLVLYLWPQRTQGY